MINSSLQLVNDPRVAYAGTLQNVYENSVATGSLANLVTDADGDALTLEASTQLALGMVTFSPPRRSACGACRDRDRHVDDIHLPRSTALPTATRHRHDQLRQLDDAPVAADDSYAADDATLTIAAPGCWLTQRLSTARR